MIIFGNEGETGSNHTVKLVASPRTASYHPFVHISRNFYKGEIRKTKVIA